MSSWIWNQFELLHILQWMTSKISNLICFREWFSLFFRRFAASSWLPVNNVIELQQKRETKFRNSLSTIIAAARCCNLQWLPFVRLYYYWKPTKRRKKKFAIHEFHFTSQQQSSTRNEKFHFHCWMKEEKRVFKFSTAQHIFQSTSWATICSECMCIWCVWHRIESILELLRKMRNNEKCWIWIKSFRGELHDENLHTEGPLSTWQLCISMTSRD